MQTTSACQHYVSRVGIIPSSTVYSLYIEFTSSGEKVRGRATRHYKLSHDSGHRELSAEPVTLRRVVVADQVLEPLAQVLCEEVEQVTVARLAVDVGDAGAGDVVLRITASPLV